jgi:hypothetical protein
VSCLFDCHDEATFDATSHYFARAMRTLYIDEPMVIFCEPHYVPKILGIRAALGYWRTKVIPMTIKDTVLYQYRDKIKRRDAHFRLTQDMILAWNSKPYLLLTVAKENPFHTTHIAWIDINLLSKHPHNSLNYIKPEVYELISKIAKKPHDKFSLYLLNAWTPDVYSDLNTYYGKYKFICVSGFLTIEISTALFLLPKIIELTEEHTKAGHLWGDEHILAFIVDKYEDQFTLLLGDYQDTIENYFSLVSNHKYIEQRLIPHHLQFGLKTRILKALKQYKTRDTVKSFNYDKYLSGAS